MDEAELLKLRAPTASSYDADDDVGGFNHGFQRFASVARIPLGVTSARRSGVRGVGA